MSAIAYPLPRRASTGCLLRYGPGGAQFRRRRATAALILAVLVAGMAASGVPGAPPPSSGAAPAAPFQPVALTTHVVQPGDTLWSIARALQPSGDVRPLVQQLADGRGGAPLRSGERLVLPRPPPSR